MPFIERKFTKRTAFRLGSLAAAPFLVAAACNNTTTEPKAPQDPTPVPTASQSMPESSKSPTIQITPTIAKNPTREPTIPAPSGEKTVTIDANGNLLVTEKGYTYTLFPQMSFAILLGKPESKTLNIFEKLSEEISSFAPNVISDIKFNLNSADQREAQNPNDPYIIKMVKAAASSLEEGVCKPAMSNSIPNRNPYSKIYMKALASYVYLKDPNGWDDNKSTFLDSECYLGVKTVASKEHQPFKIESGLTLYTNVTYDDLLDEEALNKLKPLYVQRDSFSNLRDYVTMARNLDKANAEPENLRDDLDRAAYYVQNKCGESADAREYMRLILSLVYEKYPDFWPKMSPYEGSYNGCDLINRQP